VIFADNGVEGRSSTKEHRCDGNSVERITEPFLEKIPEIVNS